MGRAWEELHRGLGEGAGNWGAAIANPARVGALTGSTTASGDSIIDAFTWSSFKPAEGLWLLFLDMSLKIPQNARCKGVPSGFPGAFGRLL